MKKEKKTLNHMLFCMNIKGFEKGRSLFFMIGVCSRKKRIFIGLKTYIK